MEATLIQHGGAVIGRIRWRKGAQALDASGNLIATRRTKQEAQEALLEHWHRTLLRPCWCEAEERAI